MVVKMQKMGSITAEAPEGSLTSVRLGKGVSSGGKSQNVLCLGLKKDEADNYSWKVRAIQPCDGLAAGSQTLYARYGSMPELDLRHDPANHCAVHC